MRYLSFLQSTLTQAAAIAQEYYGQVNGTVKPEDNNQVLTEADVAIGRYIVGAIQREYATHNIIDEEAGVIDNQSDITWVVDPIDGTSNFAAATPLYGCMIGVLHGNEPVAGGVVLPALGELYLAEHGTGATCNGKSIHVSPQPQLKNMLVSYGIDGHQEAPQKTYAELEVLGEVILNIRNLRTSNSVFDLMAVAKGSYGAFLNQTSKIWDNIAPHVIITEAGGVVTDFYGKPMDYSNALARAGDNFTVCAGSPAAHSSLQQILHTVKEEKS